MLTEAVSVSCTGMKPKSFTGTLYEIEVLLSVVDIALTEASLAAIDWAYVVNWGSPELILILALLFVFAELEVVAEPFMPELYIPGPRLRFVLEEAVIIGIAVAVTAVLMFVPTALVREAAEAAEIPNNRLTATPAKEIETMLCFFIFLLFKVINFYVIYDVIRRPPLLMSIKMIQINLL
jgi:hypothetical protein